MRYYLGVDIGGTKSHALLSDEDGNALGFAEAGPGNHEVVGYAGLRQVLEEQGLQAVCKIVLKDREVLCAMDPFDDTMLLSTLYWPDEVRDVHDLDLPDAEVEFKPAEIASPANHRAPARDDGGGEKVRTRTRP